MLFLRSLWQTSLRKEELHTACDGKLYDENRREDSKIILHIYVWQQILMEIYITGSVVTSPLLEFCFAGVFVLRIHGCSYFTKTELELIFLLRFFRANSVVLFPNAVLGFVWGCRLFNLLGLDLVLTLLLLFGVFLGFLFFTLDVNLLYYDFL